MVPAYIQAALTLNKWIGRSVRPGVGIYAAPWSLTVALHVYGDRGGSTGGLLFVLGSVERSMVPAGYGKQCTQHDWQGLD